MTSTLESDQKKTSEPLARLMAGGGELEALSHELEAAGGATAGGAAAGVGAARGEEVGELGLAQDTDGRTPKAASKPNPPGSPA